MSTVFMALGLVLVIEGLVFALAPSRLEDMLTALASFSPETRRLIGLAALAVGVLLVWIARMIAS